MVASILIVSVILCWGLGLGCVFLCDGIVCGSRSIASKLVMKLYDCLISITGCHAVRL